MTGEAAELPDSAPFHAHIYHDSDQRTASDSLQARFREMLGSELLVVGALREQPVGPHPLPQFEIHFLKRSLQSVLPLIEASGLRALVHPLTDDDLADHTTFAIWLGAPLDLDLSVMDPPGMNKGVHRFGRRDN